MKNYKLYFTLMTLILLVSPQNLSAQEERGPDWVSQHIRSRVGNVGQCWSGWEAGVIEMRNGDQTYIRLDHDSDRIKFALATSALLSGKDVWYRMRGCERVCSVQRCRIDFIAVADEGVGGIW